MWTFNDCAGLAWTECGVGGPGSHASPQLLWQTLSSGSEQPQLCHGMGRRYMRACLLTRAPIEAQAAGALLERSLAVLRAVQGSFDCRCLSWLAC